MEWSEAQRTSLAHVHSARMLRAPGCYWPWMTQHQALCLTLECTLFVIVLEPCRSGIRRNTTYYDESTNSSEKSTRPMKIQRTARVLWITREGRLLGEEGIWNADWGQEKGDTWLRRINFWNFLGGAGIFNDKRTAFMGCFDFEWNMPKPLAGWGERRGI